MKKTVSILLLAALLLFPGCSAAPKGADKSQPHLQLTAEMNNSNLHYPPSFALWATDPATGKTATLFATRKAAGWAYGKNDRPSALPVWFGIASSTTDDTDAVTQPTPGNSLDLALAIPSDLLGKKLDLYLEIDASYDFNDYYKQNLKQGEPGYSDVNGQPSLVYKATVDTSAASPAPAQFQLVGHGDVLGANHNLQTDQANITTAKDILKSAAVEYSAGQK